MRQIVILSGSPAERSRSDRALDQFREIAMDQGYTVQFFSVRDVSPEALFYTRFNDPEVVAIGNALRAADGVIIGSPVYKASYTGIFKALIDLLPEDVLKDTPVLPIMVGGSSKHLLAIEFALKPLLATLKAELLQGVYILDTQIDKIKTPAIQDSTLMDRIQDQMKQLTIAIEKKCAYEDKDKLMGHHLNK
ncbi:NADPH-dependent FMN reductase [Terrilactibacillus laevilacticus]|uniref:NADPH-dependent FMN reductase n=1 Tax=Terrilactibacillus laevilacticus TaxID=1380157 RepID=A0ABW5PQY8_9BACI|nr:NADPH-dependent FMN reductase [Terrilactibacillus laevilacticus]